MANDANKDPIRYLVLSMLNMICFGGGFLLKPFRQIRTYLFAKALLTTYLPIIICRTPSSKYYTPCTENNVCILEDGFTSNLELFYSMS